MAKSRNDEKQNVIISLSRRVLRKAKILAARRETSISGLLARQIEVLVGEEEAYERAERQAMALLDKGFHLGGVVRAGRDELHERLDVCRYQCLDLRSGKTARMTAFQDCSILNSVANWYSYISSC